MIFPTLADVKLARERIDPYIHNTPVHASRSINDILGLEVYFKCENFQKVGAFKFRGATNAVFSLSDEQARLGVATHSSGNHAAALALAARMRGIKSYIVMPESSPRIKKVAVAGYGAAASMGSPVPNLSKLVRYRPSQAAHLLKDCRAHEGNPEDEKPAERFDRSHSPVS